MKNMRKAIVALLVAICLMTFVCTLGVFAESMNQVYAETNDAVDQGSYGYAYVYLDDLTDVASLNVDVYYDSTKISVMDHYNQVGCSLYDSSSTNGCLKYSYIFDGEGSNEKTNLFYFCYYVDDNAEIGNTYFDIVITDAYDTSLNAVDISGTRCHFKIDERMASKECYIYGTYEVSTSVKEEFEVNYQSSTCEIASGSMNIQYDPELFEVVSVTNGSFLEGKITDVNTALDGSVSVSFVGTEYNYGYDVITVRFKTLKNVTETSDIKLVVSELYDKELNLYSCSGYTTKANIIFDETYTEDAPSMSISSSYNAETGKVTATIELEENSLLGAGDFVLKFDTTYLTYDSAGKGFSPSFFNINDKNVADGVLKFSIISLSDITDEQIILTVVFDAKHSCQDNTSDFEISGSGLTDSLTNTIQLNFVDSSVIIPLKHTEATAVEENRVEPTCTTNGSYDSVVNCSVCGIEISRESKIIAALGHNYDIEWTVDINPTCTEKGSKSHHCTRCDERSDVTEIPAHGHSFGTWYETKAPTCTAEGTEERECSVCRIKETRTIAANGHTNAIPVVENRVDPDCTTDGSYDSVVYCSVCNEELIRETKRIAKLGHNEIIHIGRAATCTDDGYKDYVTCSRCDYSTYETIPALGHSEVFYSAKSPTCTEIGWEAYFICSTCGYSTYVEIPALGHAYSEWIVDKEATFDTDGKKHKECTVCHEILEESITPMLKHSYTSVVTAPTCTERGYTTHTCSECGNTYVDDYVPAKGHTFGTWTQEKAPTCTAEGVERKNCSACDYYETRSVAPLGHNKSQSVIENKTEATCTTEGSYDSVVYCSVCGVEISRERKIISTLGHNYDIVWTVDLAPTCTEKGSMSHHCTRCDFKTDVTTIPENGHSSSDVVIENSVDPTCTMDGSYDEVVYCSVCAEELSRTNMTVDKLGHNSITDEGVAPTCIDTGLTEGSHCDRCDEILIAQEVIPALGHSWLDATHESPSTCERCGVTTGEKLPEENPPEENPPTDDDPAEDEHVCEGVSCWKRFWNAIGNFFRRLFGLPEKCPHGIKKND